MFEKMCKLFELFEQRPVAFKEFLYIQQDYIPEKKEDYIMYAYEYQHELKQLQEENAILRKELEELRNHTPKKKDPSEECNGDVSNINVSCFECPKFLYPVGCTKNRDDYLYDIPNMTNKEAADILTNMSCSIFGGRGNCKSMLQTRLNWAIGKAIAALRKIDSED